jgi:hypothetical protein
MHSSIDQEADEKHQSSQSSESAPLQICRSWAICEYVGLQTMLWDCYVSESISNDNAMERLAAVIYIYHCVTYGNGENILRGKILEI